MTGKGYAVDLEMVSKEAEEYARTVPLGYDGKDAWIFDIDETLLSNLPYYAAHGYGLEVFDREKFNNWVEKGVTPAIEPSLKLYEDVLNLGFKVILLTGRSERHRSVTVDNLINAGFKEWDQLILRLEVFDHEQFNNWVEKGVTPAIEPSLKLYEDVLNLGFKVILLTGRSERRRSVTVDNLINAGFKEWDQLILRNSDDQGKRAVLYKSEKRSEMEKDGYRILGNSGDQWSDLLGSSVSVRSFKLPNPMYYIP
ncbi:Acid phosphatase 1 [Glycine soja]|uniref:Acid phosphatase 1 n=1 Tax=Glycine soja TaxID=3848 RepID=A0A0B2P288_GLYSO|nr:Acid phosphatase 1 [Glycine soja]